MFGRQPTDYQYQDPFYYQNSAYKVNMPPPFWGHPSSYSTVYEQPAPGFGWNGLPQYNQFPGIYNPKFSANPNWHPMSSYNYPPHYAPLRGGNTGMNTYNQGGYNQGGYNQGGYNQGGYNQGGYNQGGYNQGGYNQGGYNYTPSQCTNQSCTCDSCNGLGKCYSRNCNCVDCANCSSYGRSSSFNRSLSYPMSQNNLNEYVHFHREGENPRMQSHLNIPMGAQVKEVIETSTGVRGSNLKKSMFTQRHMTLYETELNSAQEHLQRAAEAAKMGDWRAHDALVETALARQKSAEMHWNKCHY